MSKKKKNKQQNKSQEKFKNNPFGSIKDLEINEEKPEEKPQANLKPRSALDKLESQVENEDDLFLKAVQDVDLYDSNISPPERVQKEFRRIDEEAEAQLELIKLVNGELPFDISETDEYVEGKIRGLPDQIVKKLHKGEYALQGQLDLHGKTRTEAKDMVEKFIIDSRNSGLRCVLLIHGRGIHSKDQIPVLKESLRSWFERGRGKIGGSVLAFTSARPADGGLGAMYVLLRKPKHRV